MVRPNLRDEVPVAAEPGFYEPGRSPSLLLANWFWFHHSIQALRTWRPKATTGVRRNGCSDWECGVDIGMTMTAKSSNRFGLPPQRRTPKIKSRDN